MAAVAVAPLVVTAQELHAMIQLRPTGPTDRASFVVVDVRRTDFQVRLAHLMVCSVRTALTAWINEQDCYIPMALNLPAQSFLPTLSSLLPILSTYPLVIFHCSSSNGRGPRCAGHYQDRLNELEITSSRSAVLKGGIKGWLQEFGPENAIELDDKSEEVVKL